MSLLTFKNIGIMGRLGNQFFQIASTIGIANSNNLRPIFSKWEFTEYLENPGNYFINEIFSNYNIMEESFSYKRYEISESNNIPSMYGYFQSEKYFIDYKDEIIKLFTPNKDIINKIESLMSDLGLEKNEYISLHVRRGDYLAQQEYHPVQTIEYYNKGIEIISGNKPICIFSDDLDWCRQNFKGERFIFHERKNIAFNSSESDFVDLLLMSNASDFIISNSSYSWWGAWLSKNENKKVIAPKNWFGPLLPHETKDIYCKEWIIV